MEAAEEEDWCDLFTCVCLWRHRCSPRIRHVAPGYDYVSLPADADADGRRPAWSLLVGFKDGAKLRLHRLRVARCGRVLGRSDDALEIFHDLEKPLFDASASLAPDGVSLCVLHQDYETPPQGLRLKLLHADGRTATEEQELPPLPMDPVVPCRPVSAAGHLWAPCVKFPFGSREFIILMLRLLREDAGRQSRWEQVGEPVVSPDEDDMFYPWGGRFVQGCTVLPQCGGGDRTLILVSIRQHGLFFTFDCSTSAWTKVDIDTTPGSSLRSYIPILGHGVYMQEDETVYMLRENTIYAYKLHYDEHHRRLKLELPVKIDSVCPFTSESGYGFLAHLGSRLMCSVWISVGLRCYCKNLHAIVTTFQLPAHGEIKVLHSTCRRIDMLPSMPGRYTFCFLQEYKDEELSHYSPVLQPEEDPISSHPTAPAPLVLECCRQNLLPNYCPPSPVVPVKPAIAHIKPDLFIVCQAGTQSIVYKTNVMDDTERLQKDDGNILKQFCSIPDYGDDCRDMLEEQPPPLWHFLCGSSGIYAVSGVKDGRHVAGFRNKLLASDPSFGRNAAGPFVMAIRVGYETIALTDALEVFKHSHVGCSNQSIWSRYHIDQSHVPIKKVKLSGYAALGDDSFIVSDVVTNSCLLFDLNVKQWRVVIPCDKLEFRVSHLASSFRRRRLLNGRSVFVDGFIYTCVDGGGLDAYELLQDDDTVFLSEPIFLPFSLDIYWENERMCLDYAGKDTSGGIIFFVVQGGYPPTFTKHHVRIITVHVNTEKTLGEKMKPVEIGHLDCVTRSVEHEKGVARLSARNCFALSSCASDAPSNHLTCF